MGTENTFAEAVAAIVAHHAKLYDLLLAALPAYAGGGMPPRERRISHILNCEENDAHMLLERLATAAKAAPRGSLGEQPDILIAECRDFLDFLEERLPSPDCAAAICETRQTEEAFVNFIKGISGADPRLSRRGYALRIDKFIRDIKASFRNLGSAIVKMEYARFRFPQKPELHATPQSPPKTLPRRRQKKSSIPIEDSVKTTRRNDCAAAIKEIRRRVKNGESYAEAASYLKRNTAWNVRLAHLKTTTLIRYSKDRKR